MSRYSYGRGNKLDPALAGFAGAALAFAAFAMPEWRLTQIVSMTGLPDILSAAQPPLGFKARLGFAAALGLFSFAAFFAILRRLDTPSAPRRSASDADVPPEPIRLRRADAHPDAPVRRPLIAGRDLGEPADEELLLAPEQADAAAALPAFLVPQQQEEEPFEPSADPAEGDVQEVAIVFPAAHSTREAEAAVEAPVEAQAPASAEPEPVEPVAAAAPEPEPAPAAEGEESIGRLMKRLEFGLARRERAAPADPAAVAPRADDSVGHRLRSAISDLEKLAARG